MGYDSGGDSHRRRSALAGSERERVHEDRTGHGCRHLDLESGASEEGGGEGRVGEGERFLTPQVSRSPVEKVAVRSGERVRVEVGGREVRSCRERVRVQGRERRGVEASKGGGGDPHDGVLPHVDVVDPPSPPENLKHALALSLDTLHDERPRESQRSIADLEDRVLHVVNAELLEEHRSGVADGGVLGNVRPDAAVDHRRVPHLGLLSSCGWEGRGGRKEEGRGGREGEEAWGMEGRERRGRKEREGGRGRVRK